MISNIFINNNLFFDLTINHRIENIVWKLCDMTFVDSSIQDIILCDSIVQARYFALYPRLKNIRFIRNGRQISLPGEITFKGMLVISPEDYMGEIELSDYVLVHTEIPFLNGEDIKSVA